MGLELRQAFNAHRDKRREGQRGMCMARAHDVTKNQNRRHGNLLKRIPGNHERGATGHNSCGYTSFDGMVICCFLLIFYAELHWSARLRVEVLTCINSEFHTYIIPYNWPN